MVDRIDFDAVDFVPFDPAQLVRPLWESIVAAVSTKMKSSYPSIFAVTDKVLVDSGSGFDLIGLSKTNNYWQNVLQVQPVTFHTANGAYYANQAVPFSIPPLPKSTALPYIMKDSPTVLSLGQRVTHEGFSFVWITACVA